MRSTGRRYLWTAALACLPAWASAADQPGRVELGFVPFGIQVTSANDETLTVVGAPAGGFTLTAARGMYLQVFATDNLAVEPQLSASGLFGGGDHLRVIAAALRVNYLFRGPDAPSGYLYAGGGFSHFGGSGDSSETHPTVGFGLGFRQPIRSAGSFRAELGYERQSQGGGDGLNVFDLQFGIALRF